MTTYDFDDRGQGIFPGTLVPPSFSRDGNIGIEQDGSYLGVYTRCCYADPVYATLHGGWHCWRCKAKVNSWVDTYDGTTINAAESSSDEVVLWLASWLNVPASTIEVSIETD